MYEGREEREHTNLRKLPNISLHPHPIISMFPQERQPHLLCLRLPIPNLNKSPQSLPLEILLALLMNKTASRHRPPFHNSGKRNRAVGGEPEVVGGAKGEVGEELEVADTVGAQLEIAGWNTVGGCSAQGTQVGGLDGAGEADVGV